MINTQTMGEITYGSKDLRFPAERVAMADGKYFDKWVTDLLKSKPVFFDPHERYVENLIRCFNEVYLVEAAKEQKAATQQAIEHEKAVEKAAQQPQPQSQDESIPSEELHTMWEHRNKDYGIKRLKQLGRL